MPDLNNTMITLLIVLVALLIVVVLLVAALLLLRHRRKTRKVKGLPMHNENRLSTSSTHSFHRRTMARPSQSIHVLQEKQRFEDSSDAPPSSALPEIRITFPEEVDSSGKRQSGRVVMVHVGDKGVGMEPVMDRTPSYEQEGGGRFQSIDLERVGGLTEKETRAH